MTMTKTIHERFDTKYYVNTQIGCWEWTGAKMPTGRGELGFKDIDGKWRYKYAYRVSYELYRGPIPNGMLVCHTCDNPSCVNPHHLFLGSVQDNASDMVKKGRSTKGEKNPQAKLTRLLAEEIRQMPGTQQAIANQYGVSRELVGQIKRGLIWND